MEKESKGKYFEELRIGEKFNHGTVIVTSEEHELFNDITGNYQALHRSKEFARSLGHKDVVINGLFTLALVVGKTVEGLTQETIVANTGYKDIHSRRFVYPGDEIKVETLVLGKWGDIYSRNGTGRVLLKHIGTNQNEEVVITLERKVRFLKKPDLL